MIYERLIIWLISGTVSGLLGMVWFAFRSWKRSIETALDKVNNKLDELINVITTLGKDNTRLNSEIDNICERQQDHSKRLNDHSDRLRTLEIEHSKNHAK